MERLLKKGRVEVLDGSILNSVLVDIIQLILILIGIGTIIFFIFICLEKMIRLMIREEVEKIINKKYEEVIESMKIDDRIREENSSSSSNEFEWI